MQGWLPRRGVSDIDPPDIGERVKTGCDLDPADILAFNRMQEIRFLIAALDAEAEKHWLNIEFGREEVLDAREVAAILQLHVRTVYHTLINNGKLVGLRVGGILRFSKHAVMNMVLRKAELPELGMDRVITPIEAGKLLKIHWRTVYQAVRAGELPGLKIKGSWRLSQNELITLVRTGNVLNG
jgi:excisionase family DNA binding protein